MNVFLGTTINGQYYPPVKVISSKEQVIKQLLDDQLDIYTMTFYPNEYYDQFDKGWLHGFSKKLLELYNEIVVSRNFNPDNDCDLITQEMLNVLENDHDCI